MSQEIAKESKGVDLERVVDKKVLEDFLFTSDTKLTDKQKALFVALAVRNQLDPFKREIYAIPYGGEFNIVTGYEVYLKRAEKSGKLSGWKVWTEGQGKDFKAIIEIHRKDWNQPLVHEVFFSEYDLGRSLWKSKPITMIKKVVMAQGFRLAFPEEVGGIPYTADELPSWGEETPKGTAPFTKGGVQGGVTEPQVKLIHTLLGKKGISNADYRGVLDKEYGGPKSSKELTKKQASEIIERLQRKEDIPKEGQPEEEETVTSAGVERPLLK